MALLLERNLDGVAEIQTTALLRADGKVGLLDNLVRVYGNVVKGKCMLLSGYE